jgi:hypothetical protein
LKLQEGDVAGYWPSPAACAMRLTAAADAVAVRSIEATRRGCGWVLAITRGSRPAAHGLACGWRIMEKYCLTLNQFAEYLPLVGRTDEPIE